MSNPREIIESPLHQGKDELIAYRLNVSPTSGSATPSNVIVSLWEIDPQTHARTDVSATRLSGEASVDTTYITCPLVSVEAGHSYRLEIRYTVSGNTLEPWALILGED